MAITRNQFKTSFLVKILNDERYKNRELIGNESKRLLFVYFKELFSIYYDSFTIDQLVCIADIVSHYKYSDEIVKEYNQRYRSDEMTEEKFTKKYIGTYISRHIITTVQDMVVETTGLPNDITNIIGEYFTRGNKKILDLDTKKFSIHI
jgi:hypothetical protein